MIKNISSADNPLIKLIRSLHDKKGRTEHKLFIGEGTRTVNALLGSSLTCEYIVTSEGYNEQLDLNGKSCRLSLVPHDLFTKISTAQQPSGVLGVFRIPHRQVPAVLQAGPVCAQISDPGNLGTIIRSSIAFGFHQIILIECADPYNPKVVQASAGVIGLAQIITMTWHELHAHQQRPPLAALVVHDGLAPEQLAQMPSLMVIGNEAHGLPMQWQQQCDHGITLPMSHMVESLNASVAGAIALYVASHGGSTHTTLKK